MARTGIALGSNLGDRAANLRAALDGLAEISTPGTPALVAPLFETSPVGCPDGSPAFLNTVVEIDWPVTPLELLEVTQALELRLGRAPNPVRNAPRVIDIDILYCGDAIVDSPHLVLPHPRIAERRFVLMPLAEIRPDLRFHPVTSSVIEILGRLANAEPPPTRVEAACWPCTTVDFRIKEPTPRFGAFDQSLWPRVGVRADSGDSLG
jgi:2-amino-4-hydroxy-6-hydroxymethyldihydropteridine diphosphokinase